MDEQTISNEVAAESVSGNKKRGRYGFWTRLIALVLVIAILLSLTSVDFSLLRYQGTDQMVAAQYLMDSTSYLGENRLQRLKSLLSGFDSFSLNLQAAEIAIGKMDYERAAAFLNKCIPQSEDTVEKAELHNRLGCVYMLLEDSQQAQREFDNSISLNPGEPVPYLLRAQLRYMGGDTAGAGEDAAAYLANGGSDGEMLMTAASICELSGDLENAVEAMSRQIQEKFTDTDKALAYAERGRLQYLLGLGDQAKADIDMAKQLDSDVLSGVHYAIVALCEYDAEDFISSREDYLQAARLSEENCAEYYEQAILCGYLSEDYDFINQTIQEVKEKNLMTASGYLVEGILLFGEERYEEAESALSGSVDSGTVVAGAYYYRGLCRLALEKFQEAADDFTQALNWEEDIYVCIFNRGICYYALGEFEKAAADFLQVSEECEDEELVLSAEELLSALEAEG